MIEEKFIFHQYEKKFDRYLKDIVRWCREKEQKEMDSFIPMFSVYAQELDTIVDFMETLKVISKEKAERERDLIRDMFWAARPLKERQAFRRS